MIYFGRLPCKIDSGYPISYLGYAKAQGNRVVIKNWDERFYNVILFHLFSECFFGKNSRETTIETTRETSRETTREKILRLIEADATIIALTIAELIGITEEGIRYHLKNLKKEGILKHTGPSKSGKWVLLKKKNDEQQSH